MDIGHILANSPTIIEVVLKYLSGSQLTICAQVCSSWHVLAEAEKRRRGYFSWFLHVGSCPSLAPHPSSTQCRKFVSKHDLFEKINLKETIHKYITELSIDPQFCIVFASQKLFESYFQDYHQTFTCPCKPTRKKLKTGPSKPFAGEPSSYAAVYELTVASHLPESCGLAYILSPGVVGCNSDGKSFEMEECPAITALLIQKMPGLKIQHIPLSTKIFQDSIQESNTVKCLLIFLPYSGSCSRARILKKYVQERNGQLAVGGSIINASNSHHGFVITFSGPNVEAASVILKPSDDTQDMVEAKLKRFEETGLLQNHCIAFMFSCVARGHYVYNEYNIESHIFQKLYANIPLFGAFGNGEIGVNYLPNLSNSKKYSGKLMHEYSSVFVLISIK